jgi:protein involved in polysaccharide export with SLBB domain
MAPGMTMQTPPASAQAIQNQQKIKPTFIPVTPAVLSKLKRKNLNYCYRVGPLDVLSIIVWGHPELNYPSGQKYAVKGDMNTPTQDSTGFVVEPNGDISYPLVGQVYVGGKTVGQIRQILQVKLKKYIKKPLVEVRVIGFRSKRVFVMGEVNRPGIQAISNNPLSITEAINLAGGMVQDAANPSKIYVIRNSGNPLKPNVYWLNASSVDALLLGENFFLKNNDILFVSTSDLTRWNRAMSQILPTVQTVWMTYTMIHSIEHDN